MRGTYVFRSQGQIVAAHRNLLTTAGRREILRYLAGRRGVLGGSLGIGVGDRTPTLQDAGLVLEFARLRVDVTSPDFLNNLIMFKGTIPQMTTGAIYETGLWTSPVPLPNTETILSFNNSTEVWVGGTHMADNSRLGSQTLYVAAAPNTVTTVTNSSLEVDLSSLRSSDSLVLSFFTADTNAEFVKVIFTDIAGTTTYTKSLSGVVKGYNALSFSIQELVKSGSASLADMRKVSIQLDSKTTDDPIPPIIDDLGNSSPGTPLGYTGSRIYLDGLVLKTAPQSPETDVLVSRSVFPPIVKTNVGPMDIEYYLELTVS